MRKRHYAAIAGASAAFVIAAGVTRHEVQGSSSAAPCSKPATFIAPLDTDPIVKQVAEFTRADVTGAIAGQAKFQDQASAGFQIMQAPTQTPSRVIIDVVIGSNGDALQYWELTFVRGCSGDSFKLVKAVPLSGSNQGKPVQLPPVAA